MSAIVKTYMSPVFHRTPANPPPGEPGKLLRVRRGEKRGHQRCLLDDLLDGGIFIPSNLLEKRRAGKDHSGLFVLLSGPPGSGKSIFALELAYRLAINPNPGVSGSNGLTTFYVSAEAESQNIIENAVRLGWGKANDRIISYAGAKDPPFQEPRVILYGREQVQISQYGSAADYFAKVIGDWQQLRRPSQPNPIPRYDVLVIDSLNVFPWERDTILQSLLTHCIKNVLLLLAVIDCNTDRNADRCNADRYWEFFADLAIAFTYSFEKDYFVRKIRILKARYQDHADGEHRLKINARPSALPAPHPMSPLIKEGGIFTFPSVHRYLSQSRRDLPSTASLNSPFKELNDAIEGEGFPISRCTALVGSRGSMKSHLAYHTLLQYLLRDGQKRQHRALLISLRDDQKAAVDTLAQILANQRDEKGQLLDPTLENAGDDKKTKAREIITGLLNRDRLEILYFWPGYISPEEFFHLVVVSAERKPMGMGTVGLTVINGLEQIEARFPLCAREDMFVSGLITLLTVKGITAIVASGGHSAAGTVPAGLLPMADLILEASFRLINSKDVNKLIGVAAPAQETEESAHVVYEVVRGPGAREMRTKLLFYMGRAGETAVPSQKVWPGSVRVVRLPDHVRVGPPV